MYTCPTPNGFRGRAILLYSSKIVDEKEILRTVSNTCIYCSSDPSIRKSRHYFADSGGRSVGIVRLRTKTTEFYSLVTKLVKFT
jgi:hypothetical protein